LQLWSGAESKTCDKPNWRRGRTPLNTNKRREWCSSAFIRVDRLPVFSRHPEAGGYVPPKSLAKAELLRRLLPCLLAEPLPGQSLFYPTLLARLQIEGMPLDFLDDVFLLNLALEPAKRIFQRLAFLKPYLSQTAHTPISVSYSSGTPTVEEAILPQGRPRSQENLRASPWIGHLLSESISLVHLHRVCTMIRRLRLACGLTLSAALCYGQRHAPRTTGRAASCPKF